jgi:hypothetical protein
MIRARIFLTLGLSFLGLLTASHAHAQRSESVRAPESDLRYRNDALPPPELPSQESIDAAEQRARVREERRMLWLNQFNSAARSTGLDSEQRQRLRMNGLSREERHRLRSDIREAGFTAYGPEAPARQRRER